MARSGEVAPRDAQAAAKLGVRPLFVADERLGLGSGVFDAYQTSVHAA